LFFTSLLTVLYLPTYYWYSNVSIWSEGPLNQSEHWKRTENVTSLFVMIVHHPHRPLAVQKRYHICIRHDNLLFLATASQR